MFLSRLILNPLSRRVQKELAEPYELHRTLMRAFSEDLQPGDERVLFRVDVQRRTGVPVVLVQSMTEPDWSFLAEDPGYLMPTTPEVQNPASKPFQPRLVRGQLLRFRLRANPTFRRAGKRLAWLREEDQIHWLDRKADQSGFRIISITVVPEGFQKATRSENKQQMRHYAVRFDGILQVTDPEAFLQALRRGIGSGKAFGFGLLSIAPV